MAQWSRGFLRGHQWLEALWEETVPQELDDELGSILMTLSFFSSREIAEAFHGEAATGGQPFEMTTATIHRVLPTAVAQYAHMGRSIASRRSRSPHRRSSGCRPLCGTASPKGHTSKGRRRQPRLVSTSAIAR